MSVQTEIDSFKAKRLSQTGAVVEQAMINLEEALQGLQDNKAEKTDVAQSFVDVSNAMTLKADLVNGVVKSEQLPAFVKNIENAYYYNNQFYDDEAHTILITPSTETIYIDITGGGNNQYRWSGTAYILLGTGQLVTITTDGLMSYIDKIKLNGIAVGATKVELSLINGNIKVNGIEFQVYRISDNEVTNVKLAQMPTLTIKGNDTVGTANVKDLTVSEVQTMINGDISSNLMTSSKTIVGAINELNTNISLIDTGAIMGVKFIDNGAGFNAERYGLAKGKTFSYSTNGNTTTINSDFDTMPIYKYMRRGVFDNNSVLVFDQDAVGYDDTLSTGGLAPHTHWVGVYIPKFYFRINVTFSPTYIMDIAVSDKAFDGSIVHPVFTQHSNTGELVERDYVVFSAYEGVIVNKSTGAYLFTNRADVTTRIASDFQVGTPSGLTDYPNYMLTSVNKANAQAPATNGTLSNFRTMAQNRSTGNSSGRAITQQQFLSWTAINTLFMVEFASTDWQSILSAGVTNLTAGTYNESVSTGYTSSLNGKSGYVAGIARGTLGTTRVSSYRGIENFFGNTWKFMEGLKKSSTVAQYGIYNINKTNDYSVYANLDFTNKKEVTLMTTSNYYKYRNEELIPTNSTVSSAYVPDQYLYDGGGQITISGGSWNEGSSSGGFAVNANPVFGLVTRTVGSRVLS